jgi:AraC-like DNA-binding protein
MLPMDRNSDTIILFEKQKPGFLLAHLVEEYTYREIRFHGHRGLVKQMPCRHVTSVDFFLGDPYNVIDTAKNHALPFLRTTIRGPRTQRKYHIEIEKHFICFSIRFKPTGIYRLLGIPMCEFADEAVDSLLVNPTLFSELLEKLSGCGSLSECIAATEPILARQMMHQKSLDQTIEKMAQTMTKYRGLTPLKDLCHRVPLTSRSLERRFLKEIGITPKAYNNLIRFQQVMLSRKINPTQKWTSIAYEYNYFDQMHLVKDFKRYLGVTPTSFHPNEFAL